MRRRDDGGTPDTLQPISWLRRVSTVPDNGTPQGITPAFAINFRSPVERTIGPKGYVRRRYKAPQS